MVKKTEIIAYLEKMQWPKLGVLALRNLVGDQLGFFQGKGAFLGSGHFDKLLSYNAQKEGFADEF